MKAFIITIGDEILLGQILDTNSRYMAGALASIGIETAKILSVADNKAEIKKAVKEGFDAADLILISGGLGPTKDDITKNALAEYFGVGLVYDEQVYAWVKKYFKGKEEKLKGCNMGQAYIPEGCTAIENKKGTACAMWFEKEGKVLVSMPGVPFELEDLISRDILARIKDKFNRGEISYKMLGVYDIAESDLANRLADYEDNLPAGLSLAYLPSPAYVRLRLTGKGVTSGELEKYFDKLKQELAGLKYSVICASNALDDLLNKISSMGSLSVAESCTGGNISAMITSRAGASEYYLGSVTAYSNEVKEKLLGVKRESLARYGAVSEAVALEMAQGIRALTGSKWSVATTGIAGPSGGSAEKPVGTVWIAVSGPNGSKAECFVFSAVRERNIGKASIKALEMLMDFAAEGEGESKSA